MKRKRNLIKKKIDILKILNPIIWIANQFNYFGHLHHWSELERFARKKGKHAKYEAYDFSTDFKYF